MALIGVVIASIAGIFIRAPIFQLGLASITAILFSGYVLYDVQQVKYAGADADPILLAIDIYLDILNLFLALLRIFTYFTSDD
jgi:modulator of FtsH protease